MGAGRQYPVCYNQLLLRRFLSGKGFCSDFSEHLSAGKLPDWLSFRRTVGLSWKLLAKMWKLWNYFFPADVSSCAERNIIG